ncbi:MULTISPECIES: Atu1372/SO_1960 family protein [Streptomyces]|uniref:Atu1372/SO_1960 family protein n=1 Tax=Streptomyces TaxID=1883 RepID=UPI00211BD47C|nr:MULTISPECIES: Atu1372/SO_1960 family protein [Streptomyces]MDX2522588.1 Atu1372/SO_1960 family protein [Streptomyces stelliscabiei]
MTQPLPQTVKGDSASERLQALGLKLPVLSGTTYLVPHRTVGSTIRLSGRLPFKGGELLGQGVVGRDVELETARSLARHAALNCLAAAVQAVGDLERVRDRADAGLRRQYAGLRSAVAGRRRGQ